MYFAQTTWPKYSFLGFQLSFPSVVSHQAGTNHPSAVNETPVPCRQSHPITYQRHLGAGVVAWLSEDSLQGIDLRLPNLLPFPPNTNPQVQLFRNRPHFTAGCYPKPLPPISDMNPKCVSLAGLRISTFFPPSGRAVPRGVSSTAFLWSSIRNSNNRASALARGRPNPDQAADKDAHLAIDCLGGVQSPLNRCWHP